MHYLCKLYRTILHLNSKTNPIKAIILVNFLLFGFDHPFSQQSKIALHNSVRELLDVNGRKPQEPSGAQKSCYAFEKDCTFWYVDSENSHQGCSHPILFSCISHTYTNNIADKISR